MNIFITGANRGLGLALVQKGIERGDFIFAGVRSAEEAEKGILGDLNKTGQLRIVQVDVADEASVVKAKNEIEKSAGFLDVIINNAGILLESDKSIEELDLNECMKSFDVNTLGPIRVIKHLLPLLEKGSQQSIINISSDAGSISNAYVGNYPYCLSKVALNLLSEKLDLYLKEKEIQVLSIHPGWVRTDMGGEKAAISPETSSEGIYRLIDRSVEVNGEYVFVDYKGQPMKI
ncbi:SDR family oxidoreductase [Jeotgalibacillus proteolyticus]|uniref:3-oxoacyl-ACP reductase n=1 Tax=Jeotgalibacillus proteolyticus TaxID=2082395 RepID=A0A2S5G7Z4_9BACL|nr:SDR family oxidoreductase [Jeotgalibacillus proteolyticus]PPA69117.1 3-oxoacyl-ACP reductase [Jeotgalibacillus proteolyticus]